MYNIYSDPYLFIYSDPLTMSTQVSDDVLSNPFTVYSAKNFPGMTGMPF